MTSFSHEDTPPPSYTDKLRRHIYNSMFLGLGAGAVSQCHEPIQTSGEPVQPALEDIDDGYCISVDPETASMKVQEIRNGEIIEVEHTADTSGIASQRAILESENYWFGGVVRRNPEWNGSREY